MMMMISSVVALLSTQPPSKGREGRTDDLELRVQVDLDRNKYPSLHHNTMHEKGNQLRQDETFVVEVLF